MASYLPKPGEVVRVVRTAERLYASSFSSGWLLAITHGAQARVLVYPKTKRGEIGVVRSARRTWEMPLLSQGWFALEGLLAFWWWLARTGPVHVSFKATCGFHLTPYTPCWVEPLAAEEEAAWRLSDGA